MMRAAPALLMFATLCGPAMARDMIRPAELPPADFAGQQYVDSRGCMFVRAGSGLEVVWVPRVARDGAPLCASPPSGRRVPVAEEVGVQPVPAAAPAKASPPEEASAAAGGYFVAVGSFSVGGNADRAEATLSTLGYRVVRGQVQGASSTLTTVFAGPFDDQSSAAKARDLLRAKGFPEATVMQP